MQHFGAKNGVDFFNRQVIHSRRQRQQQRRHHPHVCQRSFPTSFRQASSRQYATTQRQCARDYNHHNAVRQRTYSFPAFRHPHVSTLPPAAHAVAARRPCSHLHFAARRPCSHLLRRYVEIADEAPTDLLSPGTVLQLLPPGSVDGLCIKNITTAQIDSEVDGSCSRALFSSTRCLRAFIASTPLTPPRLISSPNSASAFDNAPHQCANLDR